MYRKLWLLVTSCLLGIALLITSTSFAAESSTNRANEKASDKIFEVAEDELLVFETEEITDAVKLLEMGKKMENEGSRRNTVAEVKLSKNGKEVSADKVKTYVTNQKLKAKKNLINGQVSTLYRQDSFALIPRSIFGSSTTDSVSISSLPDPNSDYDSTYSVMATNTIYYTKKDCYEHGVKSTGFRFDKIGGEWELLDSQVSWDNSYIGYTQEGTAYDDCEEQGGYLWGKYEQVPSNGVPSSGVEYEMFPDTQGYFFHPAMKGDNQWGRQKIDLHRGTEDWTFEFINTLSDNDWPG